MGDLADGQPSDYDVATNRAVYPPRSPDAEETQRWLLAEKQGDIGFDAQTRRLVPLRGARLITIDETEWYATDQIPLAELRRRLAAAPLEFYSLAKLPEHVKPEEFHPNATISGVPTLVLQTAEGAVVLFAPHAHRSPRGPFSHAASSASRQSAVSPGGRGESTQG